MYPFEPATSAQKQASLEPVIVFVALPEFPLVWLARGQPFIPLTPPLQPEHGPLWHKWFNCGQPSCLAATCWPERRRLSSGSKLANRNTNGMTVGPLASLPDKPWVWLARGQTFIPLNQQRQPKSRPLWDLSLCLSRCQRFLWYGLLEAKRVSL